MKDFDDAPVIVYQERGEDTLTLSTASMKPRQEGFPSEVKPLNMKGERLRVVTAVVSVVRPYSHRPQFERFLKDFFDEHGRHLAENFHAFCVIL